VGRGVYPAADGITATAEGVKADLVGALGAPPGKIAIVHNPVDLAGIAARATEPIDDAPFVRSTRPLVVAAGRLAEVKNYPLFVAAIARLRDDGVDVDAAILGTGELEHSIRDAIRMAGLSDRVHLLGFQRNPWKFFRRASVFVLTSRYEGFGNVLIEAMACGTPVVATASPGTREIITAEDNGLLVDRHEPGAVAAAIRRVIEDRALADRLRTQASVSVRAYNVDVVARQYASVFEQLATTGDAPFHAREHIHGHSR